MFATLKSFLYSGLLDDNPRLEDGGPECASEMPLDYKLTCNLVIVIVNILIIRYIGFRQFNIIKKRKRYLFEVSLGWLMVLCVFLQLVNKIATKSVLFMLNPCHFCVVV